MLINTLDASAEMKSHLPPLGRVDPDVPEIKTEEQYREYAERVEKLRQKIESMREGGEASQKLRKPDLNSPDVILASTLYARLGEWVEKRAWVTRRSNAKQR